MVLGPQRLKADALRAGAADYLTLPTFLRDVIGVGKLSALGSKAGHAPDPDGSSELQTRLSEHYGLFYLLRAMASSERSGIVTLTRGNRRAELRIHEGTVVSASVGAMQGLPALHHLLLWEEAALSLTRRAIPKRSQLHLSAQEILDECERFLRDFAHAARDLGAPRTLYVPVGEPVAELRGLQQSQMTPLLRLFDGRRVLADVIEASPFRIFDTVRMIRRLRDGDVLVDPARRTRARTAGNGHGATGASGSRRRNGTPKSMLEEWAMVPDQRGVVGDRRTTSRKLRPLESAPAPAPIPLTTKKGASAAGEIAAAKRKPTPARLGQLPGGGADRPGPARRRTASRSASRWSRPIPASFPASQTPPPVRARARRPDAPRGAPPQGRAGDGRRRSPSARAPTAARSRGLPPDAPRRPAEVRRTPMPIRTRSGSGRQAPLEDARPPGASAPKTDAAPAQDHRRRPDHRPRRVRRHRVRLLRARSRSLQARGDRDVRRSRPRRRPPGPPAPQEVAGAQAERQLFQSKLDAPDRAGES